MTRLILLRIVALVAAAVCVAMVVDELSPSPAFCGFRAGCEDVVQSAFGRPLGIPLSLLGLLAFGIFFTLTLFPQSRPGRLIGPLALVAGVAGLGLVAAQMFVLRQTCPPCLIVDSAAILLAAIELAWPAGRPVAERRPLAWTGLAVAVLLLPPTWSFLKPPPAVPSQVRALWRNDRINVVEITDFACPHCRQTHAALEQFLRARGEHVRFVRVVAPLEHHEHGRAAAKLYLVAVQLGKTAEAADRLFATDDHAPDSLRRIAEQLGIDATEYEAAMNDPNLDAQLDETLGWVEATSGGGLPQIWIDGISLVGEQTERSLNAAWRRAVRARTGERVSPR